MSGPSFTPGPWKLGREPFGLTTGLYARYEGHEGFNCNLARIHTGNGAYEANARLIAAAPELYEALATVERLVLEQRCERGTPWDLACVTIAEKVREHVAPSLAKARGEAA